MTQRTDASDSAQMIADRWARVQERVRKAIENSGRPQNSVRIIGVTKHVELTAAASLADAGCLDLGESRPQQLWQRAVELQRDGLRWHLIGHLQRNKVAKTVATGCVIHSVDSLSLLESIAKDCKDRPQATELLLEVKVTQDSSKHGLASNEVRQVLEASLSLPNVKVLGLMTMASLVGASEQARKDFATLRVLRDQLQSDFPNLLSELSMGMSGDYAEAIAEGATMVRIGSALWED